MELTYGELTNTPLGSISFLAGDAGLRLLLFSSLEKLKTQENLLDRKPSLFGLETIGVLLSELNEYFFGIRRTFSVAIDWDIINGFQREVLTCICEIPYGELRTYADIAKTLGNPGAARAVGTALGKNPMPIVIPCHRVIGSDGGLRGYINGLGSKSFLLGLEGHKLIEGNRINLSMGKDEGK